MSRKYFETIKVKDGVLANVAYHQNRLDATLHTTTYNLAKIILPPKEGLYRCRFVYDENGYDVEFLPYVKRVVKKLKIIHHDTIEYSRKYSNRAELDALFAKKKDGDDVLIIKNGLVTDTTIANVAFFDGQEWFTPKTPLLQGTMRQKLLDEGKIKAKDITLQEIRSFKKIALMNAMIDFDIIAKDNIEDVLC